MAMSLEDLLAEEGFKRRKAKIKPRASFASDGRSMTLYTQRDKHESGSSMSVRRTERTRSDIPRYDSKGEFSTNSSFSGRKPRDNISRSGKIEIRDSWDDKRFSIGSSQDLRGSEITEVDQIDEIVEVGRNGSYRDIYLNNVYDHEGNDDKHLNRNEKNTNNSSFKHQETNRRSMKQPQSTDNRHENDSIRQTKLEDAFSTPALDEVAVKAIISIFSGYIKRFVKDEDFRTSLRHNSFASLNLIGLGTESKVIENLEQAIETVERAAEQIATLKELKRASLQLSVITGLNSSDLKEGSTSGIPNFKLSACAHLYLSVIYVIQNKDGIAAKHLLQVFCDSPLQARTILLPDLWDHVFLPHFSHLKLWYDKETRSTADSPISTNLRFLEKVYNESMDSGTCQFAMYYKDWITEGVEAPSVPLVKIPSFSVQLLPRGGVHGHASSPANHVSSQSMVSKKLYDEVFRHSHKSGVELEVYEQEDFDVSARSSNSPAPEDKQLILYSHDFVTRTNENFGHDDETHTQENNEDLGKTLCSIPKDFLCPLTGLLFEDPVTLETGQTFDRKAITDWFAKGHITCPVTRKTLQCQAVPPTNLILKRVISKWKTDHFEHLLPLLSSNVEANGNIIICTLGQFFTVFSKDERIMNARRIMSFGGLQLILRRFQCADIQEKTYILPLLSCCIEADAGCRNDIARNINGRSLLELLHGEQLESRTNAVLLLTELICLNRRTGAKSFLDSLQDEEIVNAMDHLLVFLQTCPLEQTPIVAVLLLHLDLLSETHTSNVYRQEAVDALTIALERSLSDEEVEKKCSRALLILGGFISSSGKLMTEDWILKLAGFLKGPDWDTAENEANDITVDTTLTTVDSLSKDVDEENARENWLLSLSASLLEDGKKKSFLDSVSKCLSLGNSDLVRVCLITVAWLSSSLASLPDTEFQLYAFSALISPLKQCLEYGELVEHKILASLSLLSFSTIPECRVLLTKIAEEIEFPLENLAEVTWTAKELHTIIFGQRR
ncbi:hypothetical protein DH2020_001109 [Rehmannia glutinosa]|uniref:RING-type E3 ubiquitin transferase n=1 Tax=Rehmannia glutinosa TaxID=99300 RepID=A0ABR0XYD9_REHGL